MRLYEDNVNSRITDEKFIKISADYETEQKQLSDRIAVVETELAE